MRKILVLADIPLQLLSVDDFIKVVFLWVLKRRKKKIFYLNAHTLTLAKENDKFLNVLRKSDLNYADGWGSVVAAKLSDGVGGNRINTADFINDFFGKLNKIKTRIYLLGDKEEILGAAKTKIEGKFNNIQCVVTSMVFLTMQLMAMSLKK